MEKEQLLEKVQTKIRKKYNFSDTAPPILKNQDIRPKSSWQN